MKFALYALIASSAAADKTIRQEFPNNCDFAGTQACPNSSPVTDFSGSLCCTFKHYKHNDLYRCMTPA